MIYVLSLSNIQPRPFRENNEWVKCDYTGEYEIYIYLSPFLLFKLNDLNIYNLLLQTTIPFSFNYNIM